MATYGAERIVWGHAMALSMRRKLRELAALNGISVSHVLERLIVIALKDGYEFEPLPPGVIVSRKIYKNDPVKAANYTLAIPLAEYLESVCNLGYRRDYVAWALLTRGLEIVKSRESSGHGADLDSGEVGSRPQGEGAEPGKGIYQRPLGTLPGAENGGVEAMRRLRAGVLRSVSDSDTGDVSSEGGPSFGEATGYE